MQYVAALFLNTPHHATVSYVTRRWYISNIEKTIVDCHHYPPLSLSLSLSLFQRVLPSRLSSWTPALLQTFWTGQWFQCYELLMNHITFTTLSPPLWCHADAYTYHLLLWNSNKLRQKLLAVHSTSITCTMPGQIYKCSVPLAILL